MMTHRIVRITRYAETRDGTFGVMTIDNKPFCLTLEPNDRYNGRNSCIPTGMYLARRFYGQKYPDTWEIVDVPNRDSILIHWGNLEDHSLGCILVGQRLGVLENKQAILSSKVTFNAFMEATEGVDELRITITESY